MIEAAKPFKINKPIENRFRHAIMNRLGTDKQAPCLPIFRINKSRVLQFLETPAAYIIDYQCFSSSN